MKEVLKVINAGGEKGISEHFLYIFETTSGVEEEERNKLQLSIPKFVQLLRFHDETVTKFRQYKSFEEC